MYKRQDCIIGADFIAKSGLVLDIHGHQCYFKFNRGVVIPFLGYQGAKGGIQEVACPDSARDHLTPSQQRALDQLCEEFPSVLTPTLGLKHLLEYKIQLTDSKIVRSHPYKFAPPKMAVLREKVQELLEQGVIEPSNSSYASPAFLVPKPGGKHRMVIDYRKLNANIEVDSVPLPDLHSAFDWFSEARYFTVIDLNAAYHQIPLSKESRPYTAFCVPWNLYQCTRVPMGLAVGAQTLTRLLDLVFQDVKFKFIFNRCV